MSKSPTNAHKKSGRYPPSEKTGADKTVKYMTDIIKKPHSLINIEKASIDFTSSINYQYRILVMLYNKLKYINDYYIQNINNYSDQINYIKSANYSVIKYLKQLINKQYVLLAELTNKIHSTFDILGKINQLKNTIATTSTIYNKMPLNTRFDIMSNRQYKYHVMELLIEFKQFITVYYNYVGSSSMINKYTDNIFALQNKLISSYKANPYDLTTYANNEKYLEKIIKQDKYAKELFSIFKNQSFKVRNYFNILREAHHVYKVEHNILPDFITESKDFGTYKDLLEQQTKIRNAIVAQTSNLMQELREVSNKDKITIDKYLFIKSDPKLIRLKSAKKQINIKLMDRLSAGKYAEKELSSCSKQYGKDIAQCNLKLSKSTKDKGGYQKKRTRLTRNKKAVRDALKKAISEKKKMLDDVKFNVGINDLLQNEQKKIQGAIESSVRGAIQDDLTADSMDILESVKGDINTLPDLAGGCGTCMLGGKKGRTKRKSKSRKGTVRKPTTDIPLERKLKILHKVDNKQQF